MDGTMTEVDLTQKIVLMEAETKRLQDERRALRGLAYDIKNHCPKGEPFYFRDHEWNVVRADECAVFGGQSVRSAEFECECGATMSIQDGQSKVGG